MTQTLGVAMLFLSVFILGGVTFIKVEEYAKLGMLKETMVILAFAAFIALLMIGGR